MADSQRISKDKLVELTYTITDENGEVVETASLPVSYVHGRNSGLFPKVESALDGLTVGELVSVTLSPEEGFGPHDPELTFTDDLDNVPPQFRRVGTEVEMQNDRGETRKFVVSKIEDGRLTVDGNHPFAGKTVTFHVKVAAVREATAEEKRQGRPPQAWESTLN